MVTVMCGFEPSLVQCNGDSSTGARVQCNGDSSTGARVAVNLHLCNVMVTVLQVHVWL